MPSALWQPCANQAARQARATLLRTIREFFYQREVLEVETPALSHATVTDVHLDPLIAPFDPDHRGQASPLYLQTSPEYAMKRLLCAHSGPIYQISKAFRHEPEGRWHNPEFTMLEWYRPGFSHVELMSEVDSLLQAALKTGPSRMLSYQQALQQYTGLDALSTSDADLIAALPAHGIDIDAPETLSRDALLQLLFSQAVEPAIGQDVPCFIHSFPASQAALARINQVDPRVADRFEVYYRGIELANGFYELADADEQRQRFVADNQQRRAQGLPERPVDEHLLAALHSGLPDCAGVALGIDRLLMLKLDAAHIHEVLNFPVSRA